jgi:hypothetical protein
MSDLPYTYTGGPGECPRCWPHKQHNGPCLDHWVDKYGNKTTDCACYVLAALAPPVSQEDPQ